MLSARRGDPTGDPIIHRLIDLTTSHAITPIAPGSAGGSRISKTTSPLVEPRGDLIQMQQFPRPSAHGPRPTSQRPNGIPERSGEDPRAQRGGSLSEAGSPRFFFAPRPSAHGPRPTILPARRTAQRSSDKNFAYLITRGRVSPSLTGFVSRPAPPAPRPRGVGHCDGLGRRTEKNGW